MHSTVTLIDALGRCGVEELSQVDMGAPSYVASRATK